MQEERKEEANRYDYSPLEASESKSIFPPIYNDEGPSTILPVEVIEPDAM